MAQAPSFFSLPSHPPSCTYTMSNKRKPSMSDSPAKRPRISGEDEADGQPVVTPYERPRNHPVYGQKSAFPGLEDGGNDELFYGTAEDGMEYLRMVRYVLLFCG